MDRSRGEEGCYCQAVGREVDARGLRRWGVGEAPARCEVWSDGVRRGREGTECYGEQTGKALDTVLVEQASEPS